MSTLPPLHSESSRRPLRVVVRGDCCSRRAIVMNRDLFGGSGELIRDEKSRTDFLVDHADFGSPTEDDLRRVLAVEAMGRVQQAHTLSQATRDTLSVTNADLIVMDNYADMQFQAWQHKSNRWKIWIHPKFVRDHETFEAEFEAMGRLTLEESFRNHVELVQRYRKKNGGIPILFFSQPIKYYSRLEVRAEFQELGPRLEAAVKGLYYAEITDDELEPDDMDSCGPGSTLHFSGSTYRTGIMRALQKGLAGELPGSIE